MTAISKVIIPKCEFGNDPNDYRADASFLRKIKPKSSLETLVAMSVTNRTKEMEKNLQNDVYVFLDLALSGQITLFYAHPGSGKTLIFMRLLIDAIQEERLNAEDVVYINADDSYKGLYTKAMIAKDFGFHMISPAEAGTSAQHVLELLTSIAQEGDSEGKVIVLDTLKKFADMMSKSSQSALFECLRRITAKGGTVIIAGHANKHKDKEGRLVYEGTSDTLNDIDCAYSIYRISNPEDKSQIVEFRREKDRGDVAAKAAFKYDKVKGMQYIDMVNSVIRIEEGEVNLHSRETELLQLKKKYESEILFVSELLDVNSVLKQKEIFDARKRGGDLATEVSERKLRSALDELNGIIWYAKRGKNNAKLYRLI